MVEGEQWKKKSLLLERKLLVRRPIYEDRTGPGFFQIRRLSRMVREGRRISISTGTRDELERTESAGA